MIDWGRFEFLPGWAEARDRRRQERESRSEWASRDAVFFAAIAARASYSMSWGVLGLIGSAGSSLGSRTFSAVQDIFFVVPLLAAAGVSLLAGLAFVLKAARLQVELWEAAVRRAGRVARQPMV